MPDKELPARPNLEQYKNQAKDLVKNRALGDAGALTRIGRHHPRFHNLPKPRMQSAPFTRTDAQLVIAREHGFESWPKFARHIEMLAVIRSVAFIADPVAVFLEMASAPRHSGHGSGTLEHAEAILSRYPQVARANVYTAAILADEGTLRGFLASDPQGATAKGGPYGWDALTYLCFSRYLRIDKDRSDAFVRTARALLEAGANANTGWYEMIDHPKPRPVLESAIYGAAGIAQHPELTRLLLEQGADPNDEETPYHVPETRDNTVMKILLESGLLNAVSLSWMLIRKADWHDEEGLRILLAHGADPNAMTRFGNNALHHALRRDNHLKAIELLLDHAANPALENTRDGRSAISMAARRGRGDVLAVLEQRGISLGLHGVDRLIAACAKGDSGAVRLLLSQEPHLAPELIAVGGTLLAEFAGNGSVEGIRCLLDLGVGVAALYQEGDRYFDIATDSTALHVAAWRAWPDAVGELIDRGAPVNALDGMGRTALALAVKACVDSYWTNRRSPASVEALLKAGALVGALEIPSGYAEVDELLRRHAGGHT
ncbi:MAG TPA: ankyrin repeat domain-containing protein [Bryobacteraceae bacterium]